MGLRRRLYGTNTLYTPEAEEINTEQVEAEIEHTDTGGREPAAHARKAELLLYRYSSAVCETNIPHTR